MIRFNLMKLPLSDHSDLHKQFHKIQPNIIIIILLYHLRLRAGIAQGPSFTKKPWPSPGRGTLTTAAHSPEDGATLL